MLKNILLLLLFLPIFCMATDLKPWFGNEYEFEFRATGFISEFRFDFCEGISQEAQRERWIFDTWDSVSF